MCQGCLRRDAELQRVNFENFMLKEAIENHKKTIEALESLVGN